MEVSTSDPVPIPAAGAPLKPPGAVAGATFDADTGVVLPPVLPVVSTTPKYKT